MTIVGRKNASCKGVAWLVSRNQGKNNKYDWKNIEKPKRHAILVSFNTKDELQLKYIDEQHKTDSEKEKDRPSKVETFRIDEILDCTAEDIEDLPNALLVETLKNHNKEELLLQFENEQEFRRTLFTYKYFKMRNRLSSSSSNEGSDEGSSSSGKGSFGSKSLDYVSSKYANKENSNSNSIPKSPEYDLMQVIDDNGVTHMSVESKKPQDMGEIDGLIYTDVEYDSVDYISGNFSSSEVLDVPLKPLRRKQLLKRIKGKAPPPPAEQDAEIVRGQVVKLSIERNLRDSLKPPISEPLKTTQGTQRNPAVINGYESDREDWRSRSTFSSSAFHSLARPARRALINHYRPQQPPPPPPQTLRRPLPPHPRTLQEYKPYQEYVFIPPKQDKRNSLPNNFIHDFKNQYQKQQEQFYGRLIFNNELKKTGLGGSMNYLNISSRLNGLTDKLKEFSSSHNKNSWNKREKSLKPVIKKSQQYSDGEKRPVVRSCSVEPPKKVTFSAFATVQVV